MSLSFGESRLERRLWGSQSWLQAGLPAGWTRWKAGPQAEKPAPQTSGDPTCGKTKWHWDCILRAVCNPAKAD
jgi:hypothetical protein